MLIERDGYGSNFCGLREKREGVRGSGGECEKLWLLFLWGKGEGGGWLGDGGGGG